MGIEQNNLKSIEGIAERYRCILIESSALYLPIIFGVYKAYGVLPREQKTAALHNEIAFLKTLTSYVKNGHKIYITRQMLEGNRGGGTAKYRSHLKGLGKRRRSRYVSATTLEAAISERNRLISTFENHYRVIDLSSQSDEMYKRLEHVHSDKKGKYELDEADFNLLITSVVLAKREGSCAILSNDSKIREGWKAIRHCEGISFLQLGFFFNYQGSFRFIDPENYALLKEN